MKTIVTMAGAGLMLGVLFAGKAVAADRKTAASAAEGAFCRSSLLREEDAKVSAALDAVLKLTAAADRPALTEDQRIWRKNRDNDCAFADDGETAAKPADLEECMFGLTSERIHWLAGLPAEGMGADATIVPVVKQ